MFALIAQRNRFLWQVLSTKSNLNRREKERKARSPPCDRSLTAAIPVGLTSFALTFALPPSLSYLRSLTFALSPSLSTFALSPSLSTFALYLRSPTFALPPSLSHLRSLPSLSHLRSPTFALSPSLFAASICSESLCCSPLAVAAVFEYYSCTYNTPGSNVFFSYSLISTAPRFFGVLRNSFSI